jgi:hypothetical protein
MPLPGQSIPQPIPKGIGATALFVLGQDFRDIPADIEVTWQFE